MAREKHAPTPADDALIGHADAPPVLSDAAQEASAPRTAPAAPAPIHTRDRDPARRAAWKRERAIALGHATPDLTAPKA